MIAPLSGTLVVTQLFASHPALEAYTAQHVVDNTVITIKCLAHPAYDLSCPVGTPAFAVKSGTVHFYGPTWGFPEDGYDPLGLHAVLTLPDGEQFWYAHLSQAKVPPGTVVQEGAVIALTGNTGNVEGTGHLHFAWRPAHVDYFSGFDGFQDWICHLDHDVFPLFDLSLV